MRHSSCRFAEPGPSFSPPRANRGPGSAAHRFARATRCAASGAREIPKREIRLAPPERQNINQNPLGGLMFVHRQLKPVLFGALTLLLASHALADSTIKT